MSLKRESGGKTAADRIRATAARLFYRQGIRAVGVDELVVRAGATKPSLYRSFESKDQLAAAYLRDFATQFWRRFDAAVAAHVDNPRAQLRELFKRSTQRTRHPRYRGCGLSNAAVEYPDATHPARQLAHQTKSEVRRRLTRLVTQLDVTEPKLLGDGLTMLLEGAYVSRQIFGAKGPAQSLSRLAERMIDQWPRRRARAPHARAPVRKPVRGRRARRSAVRAQDQARD